MNNCRHAIRKKRVCVHTAISQLTNIGRTLEELELLNESSEKYEELEKNLKDSSVRATAALEETFDERDIGHLLRGFSVLMKMQESLGTLA